ncbi:MAG: magnesium transporter [Gemmatimonadetes bacterium]|nr:magnesium transporter [Gemmatimonadota bacterium]
MSERTAEIEEQAARLSELLRKGDTHALAKLVEDVHPSDLADILEGLEEAQRVQVLEFLPPPVAAEALAEMEGVERPEELLAQLEPGRLAEVVEEMPDDDAADLIGELEPEEQARVLASLPDSSAIEELLHYAEDTAGGIMTSELVAVPFDITAGQALFEIRRQARDVPDFYTIFVVGSDRRLRGVTTLQDLVLADPEEPITQLTEQPAGVVPVDMDQEEVGRILSRYNLASIGVVDELDRLVGRITFDDVIDVIEAETTEDILRFAAVSEEEELRGGTLDAARRRLPWLALNLLTALMGASVVFVFRETIERMVILAAVMPMIAGLGGNSGTQALAVTIRRIALSDESLTERWSVVRKELTVGLINGFLIGGIVALAGLLLVSDAVFGLVVMLAMWGNLVVGSTMGGFMPIFLESIGVDPAVASSVFVTALTDLCGFFLLLGLASAFLL